MTLREHIAEHQPVKIQTLRQRVQSLYQQGGMNAQSDAVLSRAFEELAHALVISNQIDYLGGMPALVAKPVKTSEKAEDMLRFDLDNENETIRNYRERVTQCEALGEYALSEQIRKILVDEQDHQIALATALGIDVPRVKAAAK